MYFKFNVFKYENLIFNKLNIKFKYDYVNFCVNFVNVFNVFDLNLCGFFL